MFIVLIIIIMIYFLEQRQLQLEYSA